MKRREFLGWRRPCGRHYRDGNACRGAVDARLKWRCTSSFPKSLDILYGTADVFAKAVAEATDNNFQVQVFAAGDIVPGLKRCRRGDCRHRRNVLRMASGPFSAIRRGSARAVAITSSAGTTRLTSPTRSASAAEIRSPTSRISAAWAYATWRDSRAMPPAAGISPRLTSISPSCSPRRRPAGRRPA